MGYDDDTIRETERGFSYDRGRLENLGIVERNGVRLMCDRTNGRLVVERMEPTLDTIRQDLETVIGDD